ncbi:MAG TPA: peptide-methionine (S)-S-oxide reductase MsrA [Spirochaetota bacterium]|nr:peptide-methionine (S)-S-oxide reductase MsrA [Spirochaetota bacterium]HPS87144.1 peptide-methionine (S)-S-oxide reductase MsrA [Spirochaetota bacterium]
MTSMFETLDRSDSNKNNNKIKSAYFAGGCFWCTEHDLKQVHGVQDVISGYSGGDVSNPTYVEVCSGMTGHREAVKVLYNPDEISYRELVDEFLKTIDPLDSGGQFFDRGLQYTNAVFYLDDEEKNAAAEQLKKAAEFLNVKEIAVTVLSFKNFFEAEEYHQKFSDKMPERYCSYRDSSGRDQKLKIIWKIEK